MNKLTRKEMKVFLTHFQNTNIKMQNWLHSIPSDIRMAFLDNEYIRNYSEREEFLFKQLFIPNLEEMINWFLYEIPGSQPKIQVKKLNNEKEFLITGVEAFLDYLEYVEQILPD